MSFIEILRLVLELIRECQDQDNVRPSALVDILVNADMGDIVDAAFRINTKHPDTDLGELLDAMIRYHGSGFTRSGAQKLVATALDNEKFQRLVSTAA